MPAGCRSRCAGSRGHASGRSPGRRWRPPRRRDSISISATEVEGAASEFGPPASGASSSPSDNPRVATRSAHLRPRQVVDADVDPPVVGRVLGCGRSPEGSPCVSSHASSRTRVAPSADHRHPDGTTGPEVMASTGTPRRSAMGRKAREGPTRHDLLGRMPRGPRVHPSSCLMNRSRSPERAAEGECRQDWTVHGVRGASEVDRSTTPDVLPALAGRIGAP